MRLAEMDSQHLSGARNVTIDLNMMLSSCKCLCSVCPLDRNVGLNFALEGGIACCNTTYRMLLHSLM